MVIAGPAGACVSITGELLEAISKYGRKYGWQHPVLRMEFRGVTPRYSAAQI